MIPFLPINFNIEIKQYLQKNDFGCIVIAFPGAATPYRHSDGTVWLKAASATWPFETVMKNLPEVSYT